MISSFSPGTSISIFVKYLSLPLLFVLVSLTGVAQVRTWTGAAGDGLWSSSGNWSSNLIPTAGDDVIIDGSVMVVNYTVMLPNTAVTVKTLQIIPLSGQTIQVTLPSSNTVEPAFTATGPGYGLLIDNGAIFQNASGLASGESLLITDSIRIGNGGKYIHHTRASHANNIVRLLSRAPGTELGVFEFDVPRSSYTISASNRTYGTLSFSSMAAGGTVNYTCNGSNPLKVQGNLRIGEGVSFTVDLGGANGNLFVKGDFIQNGGVFNIASGAGNSTVVEIDGNLIQSSSGLITETNSGFPSIELGGTSLQVISLTGSLQNHINFRMNNPEGAILLSPLVLPYALELKKGKITTSSTSLLTLGPGCSIIVDSSTANTSYIDGPLRKEGLNNEPYFLFPVGKNPGIRWLELKQAVGSYTVEYVRSNARSLTTNYGAGIDHISSREYWTVTTNNSPVPAAHIELSFQDPESGGVTDLSTLRIAELSNDMWTDAGATSVTGQFGFAGSVVSNFLNPMQQNEIFTLGSSVNLENPLPVKLLDFHASSENGSAILDWKIDASGDASYFEIQEAAQDMQFENSGEIPALDNTTSYEFKSRLLDQEHQFFRLKVYEKNGNSFFSRTVEIAAHEKDIFRANIFPTLAGSVATLAVRSLCNGDLTMFVIAMDGKTVERFHFPVTAGDNNIFLDLSGLPAGMYTVMGFGPKKELFKTGVVKK